MVRITQIDYLADSAPRFRALSELAWPAFLDSGRDRFSSARFDILTAEPYLTLTTRGHETELSGRAGTTVSDRDPLELLKEALGPSAPAVPGMPFSGGALGYLSYDLGRRYEDLPVLAANDLPMPELAVGVYDWAVIVNHLQKRSWLVGHGRDERTFDEWDRLLELATARSKGRIEPFEVLTPVRSNLSRSAYERAFERIEAHIRRGDCYQVNLTQRFEASTRGDAWDAYCRLREISPAPFSAYLDYPFGRVLSSSPERFLKLAGDRVETKPIKGTRRRSMNPKEDFRLAEELRVSAKDRAENVMIVDLLRNDLGKSCSPGSVRATKLFDVESFANVHHLVSTVEGRLADNRHPVDLLRGCFPGGSITGAPKVRAMQIIETLEPNRRGVYCGAIGYIGFDRSMDTNVAIRTLVHANDSIYAWSGGGIVADSEAESEYQESLDKASALLAVLDAAAIAV